MSKYETKKIIVHAIQYNKLNKKNVEKFLNGLGYQYAYDNKGCVIVIHYREKSKVFGEYDYIVICPIMGLRKYKATKFVQLYNECVNEKIQNKKFEKLLKGG